MNEDIKQKIENESWRFLQVMPDSDVAKNAIKYGYSLAEQEINRLKGLIESSFQVTARKLYFSQEQVDREWQQFKTTHNL